MDDFLILLSLQDFHLGKLQNILILHFLTFLYNRYYIQICVYVFHSLLITIRNLLWKIKQKFIFMQNS